MTREDVIRMAREAAATRAAKRTPPQRPWVGLTDADVNALQDFAYADDVEFIRHIEAALKDKNT
jgi:hypothetical protein